MCQSRGAIVDKLKRLLTMASSIKRAAILALQLNVRDIVQGCHESSD
jgi:hypothetical protein